MKTFLSRISAVLLGLIVVTYMTLEAYAVDYPVEGMVSGTTTLNPGDSLTTTTADDLHVTAGNGTYSGDHKTWTSNGTYLVGEVTYSVGQNDYVIQILNPDGSVIYVQESLVNENRGPELTEEEVANQLQRERDLRTAAIQAQRDRELQEFIALGKAPENRTIAGTNNKSKIDGLYYAKGVKGISLSPHIQKTGNEYATTWDITDKKSPEAAASLQAIAKSMGAKIGPMFQMNIGTKTNSGVDYSDTTRVSEVSIGLPASFIEGFDNSKEEVLLLCIRGDGYEYLSETKVFDIERADGSVVPSAGCYTGVFFGECAYALIRLPKVRDSFIPLSVSETGVLIN